MLGPPIVAARLVILLTSGGPSGTPFAPYATMWTDETLPLPEPIRGDDKPPFEYGEQTTARLTTQTFAFDEYETRAAAAPGITVATEPTTTVKPEEDPLTRIEKTLERAIASIGDLQRRIDSIDESLAEFIRR